MRVTSEPGDAAVGEEGEAVGDWAEQPRQINRRSRKARRTIIDRSHLNMSKRLIISRGARRTQAVARDKMVQRLLFDLGHTADTRSAPRSPRFSGRFSQEFFSGQELIHRAGAESLEIESHEFESQSFEDGGELAGHLGG